MAVFVRKHLKLLLESDRDALIHEQYTEFSKQGWFLYFWKEARDQTAFIGKSPAILAFFNELFEVPKEWDPADKDCQLEDQGPSYGYKPKATPVKTLEYKQGKTWDNVDDQILYNLLFACLQAGFEKIKVVPNGNELGELAADSPLAFARHTLILDRDNEYTLGWRGDSRDIGQIGAAGGFISKAESETKGQGEAESYAERIQTRKPWHPFSKKENRTDYYFRKMQQDNCLHTVVSVTLDFVTASTFPKLEDMLGALFGGHAINSGDEINGLSDMLRNKLCRVVIDGKTTYRYADRQQLYLVVLFGKFFDTQKRQSGNPFPEAAVKQIPVKNILGSLSFVRVFDGLHESEGFTAFWDQAKTVEPTLDRVTAFAGDKTIAETLLVKLKQEFTKITSSMPFHARWTGSGGQKIGVALNVSQVTKQDGTRLL